VFYTQHELHGEKRTQWNQDEQTWNRLSSETVRIRCISSQCPTEMSSTVTACIYKFREQSSWVYNLQANKQSCGDCTQTCDDFVHNCESDDTLCEADELIMQRCVNDSQRLTSCIRSHWLKIIPELGQLWTADDRAEIRSVLLNVGHNRKYGLEFAWCAQVIWGWWLQRTEWNLN